MKRFLFLFFGWLLGFSTLQSQSVIKYHYWYDNDIFNKQNGLLGNGNLLLDVNGLSDGLHSLYVMLEGETKMPPQRYMFVKMSPHLPPSTAGLRYRYWYDDDITNNQSGLLGDGVLILDANDLSEGLHSLYVMLEGESVMPPQRYMFVKMSPQLPPSTAELRYRYWYDNDITNNQSGLLGDGVLVLDANGLSEGLHSLYVMLEGETKMPPQRYMFVKMSPQLPPSTAELRYRYWYDNDITNNQSGLLGDGVLILDANGLSDGLHSLYVMLEGETKMPPQRYMFVKMSPQLPPSTAELRYRYWYDNDITNNQSGLLGDGNLLLDATSLEEGDHTLHIMLEGNSLILPQSYDFTKNDTLPAHFAIVAMTNPIQGGTVTGAGTYFENEICTLTATPNTGFTFGNWTKEGAFVSDSFSFSFMVTESAIYMANFEEQPALDTTIYAEICYGEDYLQNGFEIYYPEVGENQYSITLPSAQGNDSIVNLLLTVHPVYFFTEDTTLCNATSYTWHGHAYTESGIYYDSLQTIHGCDSIFQLSLEFFNTPLGEFASMTPTNNYPFTSLPITFSWDAVSGAEYYNLFLWNTDDPVPSTPFASNIYNRSCYVSSLQNHQTYNWYVEAVNTCFSSTSGVRSFSLNIPPSMNVSTNSLAFGEVVLNDSVSMNMFVSGNALDDAITLQITGEDASMFSFEQGSNWNGLMGGSLTVTFSPTAVQYNYTANLVITTGTLTQTVQLTGSLADMFVFNTYVTQDVFEMNSTIPIYGTVMDINNNPMTGAEVEVKVMVMGTTRSLFATTGDDGHFSVEFVPAYSESGYYTVNSGRVGHNSTAVHDDFNIPGMNLVTNGWILWDVVQNETTTGSIVIRNRSQIPLTNIQVTATNLPDGCSFTFQPLSLQGMEEGVLEYSVTGSALTFGNNYEEVRLVATSAEGATMNFSAWYYCAEPRGILYAAPNNITTTMTKGNSKIVDVMLYNNGTGPTGNVYLDLPSVDWLSVVGNDTLASIAVHDSAYFSLRLSANENTPLVQYTGNIAINCERGDGLSLPYTITAVSDSTGTLVVDVTDDYTYNGNGQHLAGATVTVKGYYSLQTVVIGLTGSDGTFTVEDIPEGYYRMSITAPHHAEYQATIQIEGGQTNTQNIYLQYQAITYSWNVVPTEIEDEYTFELIVEYETNVPVPVVVIDMPQTFPELEEGESYVFNYIITNYGLVDTYDATLYPPTGHPLYDFTPLITEIDTLHAQSTVVVPCTMTRRTAQRSQAVSEALGRGGNREETECPYSALTQTKQYYICGDRENWFWANVWRNIGSTPCQIAPANVNPSGGGGPGSGGSGGGGGASSSSSSTPAVTVQNNDCNLDPCLTDTKDSIDNCYNNGNGTIPNLPPQNPANNR